MMREVSGVITSLDGMRFVDITRYHGVTGVPNRAAIQAVFLVQWAPEGEPYELSVLFSKDVQRVAAQNLGLTIPSSSPLEGVIPILALAAIGDGLDSGELETIPPPGTPISVNCFSERLIEWQQRARASEDVALDYIKWKLFRNWQFDRTVAVVGPADMLRLHLPSGTMDRLLDFGNGSSWKVLTEGDNEPVLQALPALVNEMKGRVRRQEHRPGAGPQASTLRPIERLFLSHSGEDRALAEFVKLQLERQVAGLEVFLTSFPGMIPAGADWLTQIKSELERADGYVVLLTPASVHRPWIVFETGAAWMSKRPLATVSAGALDRGEIPMPLGSFQVLSLEVPREAESVFKQLGGALENPEEFAREITVRSAPASPAPHCLGWSGVTVGKRFFAWDGPELHALEDRPAIPTPQAAIAARGPTATRALRDPRLTTLLHVGIPLH